METAPGSETRAIAVDLPEGRGTRVRALPLALLLPPLLALATGGCGTEGAATEADPGPEAHPAPAFHPGTVEDRAALFDVLVESTLAWDAFASLPDHPVHRAHPTGMDVGAEMERYRDELLAGELNRIRDHIRHSPFYGETLALELERPDGNRYAVELPYLPDDPDLPLVLLQWHRFDRDLPGAMDALMDYAVEHDLLDRQVIVDATHSGGGSRGSYAVRRLQPQPHGGTFGNLKVSEAMERWVEDRIQGLREGRIDPASEDDGTWKLEWLEEDVRLAIREGHAYTNDVPFKGAHAPKCSDGILEPHEVHFQGGLTVWLSPRGGSHLDQFAAQVVDNGLGHLMGMSTGGFSNTWQTTEVLRFPTTGRPIVTYQWSLGHSIRPNGELLQYNPAVPHESIPQTRENHFDYHARLLHRTLDRLGMAVTNRDDGP